MSRGMRFWMIGVPIIGSVLIGTAYTTLVAQDKFDRQKLRNAGRVAPPRQDEEVPLADNFDLQAELQRMERKLDLEDWKQVRVPRPGEPQETKE